MRSSARSPSIGSLTLTIISPFSYSAAASGAMLHAQLGVLLVAEPGLEARALLDPDLVAALDQVAGGGRHQCYTPFQGLGFLGYTDAHDELLLGLSVARCKPELLHIDAPCNGSMRPPS